MKVSNGFRVLAGVLAILVLAAAGCDKNKADTKNTAPGAKRDDRVLATVDGEDVMAEDYLNSTRRMPPLTRQSLADLEKRRASVSEFLDDKVLFVEAKKQGLDKDPEVVRRVQEYNERLVIQQMRRSIQSKQIDDKMTEDYYNAHKADEFTQERSRFSMILKRRRPGTAPAEEKKLESEMQSLAKKLKSGSDFAKAAQKESEDPSAPNGGDLGPIALEMRGPQVAEVGKALKINEVSDPVNVGYAWIILKRMGAPEQVVVPIEEAKPRIVQKLRIQAIDEFKAEAKKNANVKINEDVLSSLDLGGAPGGMPGMNPMQMMQQQGGGAPPPAPPSGQ